MNASAKAAPSIEGADNRGQTTVLMLGGQLLADYSPKRLTEAGQKQTVDTPLFRQ
jgi:hypothetical protein